MKRGYKHKTGVFGADSEAYASRLFWMLRNPQGSNRPDLLSVDGRFDPKKLSIELKSGRNKKGVLVDYQLHYAVTTADDYVELFGEDPKVLGGMLPGMSNGDKHLLSSKVAYYYNVINRADELKAGDVNKPFSSVQIVWGDQFMVPHQFAFYNFAVNVARRTGNEIGGVVHDLWDMIREDVEHHRNGSFLNYSDRKGSKQSWQDIHGRDIEAIFKQDMGIATKFGVERMEIMREIWPAMDDLVRVEIPAPNGTTIYVLANCDDVDLFEGPFRGVVEERNPVIEKIHRQRRRAVSLLDKITFESHPSFFDMNDTRLVNSLSVEEIRKLSRLVNWMDEGEEDITVGDYVPF
ncbi:MAG: hypothetical protein KKF56_03860 [Nanoarchaeota archaeon]|nr:hypothetical protein [Nanoarchaeota archaeon]